jgi:hypothetical protein
MPVYLQVSQWGGLDSNQRPTDYEFDRERFGDQAKPRNMPLIRHSGYAGLLSVSERFAAHRGTHAGHRQWKGLPKMSPAGLRQPSEPTVTHAGKVPSRARRA